MCIVMFSMKPGLVYSEGRMCQVNDCHVRILLATAINLSQCNRLCNLQVDNEPISKVKFNTIEHRSRRTM